MILVNTLWDCFCETNLIFIPVDCCSFWPLANGESREALVSRKCSVNTVLQNGCKKPTVKFWIKPQWKRRLSYLPRTRLERILLTLQFGSSRQDLLSVINNDLTVKKTLPIGILRQNKTRNSFIVFIDRSLVNGWMAANMASCNCKLNQQQTGVTGAETCDEAGLSSSSTANTGLTASVRCNCRGRLSSCKCQTRTSSYRIWFKTRHGRIFVNGSPTMKTWHTFMGMHLVTWKCRIKTHET